MTYGHVSDKGQNMETVFEHSMIMPGIIVTLLIDTLLRPWTGQLLEHGNHELFKL